MHDATKKLQIIAQSIAAPGSEPDAQGVIEIVCADLAAMLSFYEQLGFSVARRTGPFAVLIGFGIRIFVAEDSAAITGKRWINLRILVPDVDVVWRCIKELDASVVHGIADRFYGLRDFVVRDPSGFDIRFAQVARRES
jgi:catechol 2,3-dioxygenase-like lactoylglutathione lyase family enzyme